MAVCGTAASLGGLGLATLITKEMACDRDRVHRYLQGAIAMHLLMIVPMVLMTASFSVLAHYSTNTLTIIAILTLGVISGFLARSVSRSDCIRGNECHRARHSSSLRRRRLANC